ncbi:SGNH/GDSL hydrolase family protein [Geofilum sp. OHC36d9]|uniref:SGNH/GDSL hydrolase family protein n=1 Tax=Geofilum sp. OHC36d9 TaxID=3458413 RepID=UPI0040335D44
MKMSCFKYFALMISTLFLWGCDIKTDDFEVSNGTADFSAFVALGDSYSAGFMNGALGHEGQLMSLPALLAQQFEAAGGGAFVQPLTADGKSVGTTVINTNGDLNGYYELKVVDGSFKPVPTIGDKSILASMIGQQGPYNNMAVPGLRSFHLLTPLVGDPSQGAGNYNPFYARFASEPGVSTVLSDAMLANPTFFSLWIGGNDVLSFALAGGESDSITSVSNFAVYMNMIVGQLAADGREGAIANIPDIVALPYFNVIPYNALPLDQASADALNEGYSGYNALAASVGYDNISFSAGQNALIVEDPQLVLLPEPYRFRQMTATEKLLLSLPTEKLTTEGWGSQVPVPAKYVLALEEIEAIHAAVAGYNLLIKDLSVTYDLALVDLFSLMNEINAGTTIDGGSYSTDFVTGGIISLDGIHATPRGYAVIANTFINAINDHYNANVATININDYRTVKFP